MSWFDQKKNEISETELIAYHLHELPPGRERAVARALERSASLTAVSASVEATLRAVKDTPKPIDQAAFTRTWAALQPALKPYATPLAVRPRWRTPALAKAALAGLTVVGVGVGVTRLYRPARESEAPGAPAIGASATPNSNSSAHPVMEDAQQTASGTSVRLTRHPSTGRFPDRLSNVPSPSLPEQSEVPPVHALTTSPTPLPALSDPQTATAEPLGRKPNETTLQVIPPFLPDARAGQIAQTSPTASLGAEKKLHRSAYLGTSHAKDLMLALGGTFIPKHSSLTGGTESRTVQATAAIAALGSFHQQFHPALGYRVTLSYTRPEFQYTTATNTGSTSFNSAGSVNSRIFEAAGTYVVQGPHRGRLSTAADLGFALVAFLPTQDPAARYVYRGAGVLGASADYALSRHWAARATYRAQLFRSPEFRYLGYAVPVTASRVISHEPSLGIVYRFGRTESRTLRP